MFSLDSTNVIDPNYVHKAIKLLYETNAAAVYGRIINHQSLATAKYQWRNKYLFNGDFDYGNEEIDTESLSTYATLTKRNHILQIGNFNKEMRHSEDQELAKRIKANGLKIIASPNLFTYSVKEENIFSMYERYWRWNYGYKKNVTMKELLTITKFFTSRAVKFELKRLNFRLAFFTILCPTLGYLIYRHKVL